MIDTKNIIIDYNGEGKWSRKQINLRYYNYCKQLKINSRLNINPRIIKNLCPKKTWIYPVMYEIIKGIERGDCACKIIGVELVEDSNTMPFGRILKSNTARALRRTSLDRDLELNQILFLHFPFLNLLSFSRIGNWSSQPGLMYRL